LESNENRKIQNASATVSNLQRSQIDSSSGSRFILGRSLTGISNDMTTTTTTKPKKARHGQQGTGTAYRSRKARGGGQHPFMEPNEETGCVISKTAGTEKTAQRVRTET
jgi:hypothetical protein